MAGYSNERQKAKSKSKNFCILPFYFCLILFPCLLGLGCGGAAKTGDLQTRAVSLNDEGYQDYQQGRLVAAEGKFSQALKLNRLIDRRQGIASNLNNLGVIAQQRGAPDEALAYFREALAINRALSDPTGLSETLNNMGSAYLSQGKVEEARKAYQEALEYAQTLPPGPLQALSLTHLGDTARARGDYGQALAYYQQALAVHAARKNILGQAVCWERLGRTFVDLKDYPQAGSYLHRALKEFRRLEYTDGIADTLKDLTRLALAQGDRQEASLQGGLLLEIYRARGQEQEARKLEALLQNNQVH